MSLNHFVGFHNVTKKDSFILSTFRDLNILSLFTEIDILKQKFIQKYLCLSSERIQL